MIKLFTIPNYNDELVTEYEDYNYNTPLDEVQHLIESNLEFIENEEAEFKDIVRHAPHF